MKKTMITLAALSSLASAEVLLDTDFTTATSAPTGWTEGSWNKAHTPYYNYTELGAANRYSWEQNHLDYAITLSSGQTYTIEFEMVSKGEVGNMFYLTSSSYTILMGQSYGSNKCVSVGTKNNWDGQFICFQEARDNRPETVMATSSDYAFGGQENPVTLSYEVTLSAGKMTVIVTDGTTEWNSGELAIADDFTFTGIGFINDASAGNSITKNIKITTPEPATATLSLLALAGLAARRRRH